MLLTKIIHMNHLLKAENTEVENNFLRSIIKVESIHYGYQLINNVCYLGHLRSAEASDLIPCKNSVKDFCKVSHPLPMWCFLCCWEQSPLLGRDIHAGTHRYNRPHTNTTHTKIHTSHTAGRRRDKQIHKTAFKQTQIQTHRADRQRTKEHEVEDSNLDLLLVKWLQGKFFYYFP